MTGAELKSIRQNLGLSPRAMALKLMIRGPRPEGSILRWEEGNTKKYAHKAVVPGHIALKALAMRSA
jgi:hypothetical protein